MKHLKFFFALAALWMAGSIGTWATVGYTFTATNQNGVDITYLVLTENGTTGTVQVGDGSGSNQAIPTTTVDGETVFDIPAETFVIPSTVSNGGITYTVTAIGYGAFQYYGKTLTAITIPPTLTEIGEWAFYASGLETVELSEGLTSIGEYAFYNCEALTAIEIPQSVSTLGENCFVNCSELKSVTLHEGALTKIGNNAFAESGITSINIPTCVTSIGSGAFSGCSSLESVELPNGLTSIGYNAFGYCESLPAIDIPSSVSELGYYIFEGCTQLTTVTLHEGQLTEIPQYMFSNSGITSISIPEGVTDIRKGAFMNCKSLETAFIPSTVTSIELYAFYQCDVLEEVTITCDETPSLPYRSDWVFSNSKGKVDVLKTAWGNNISNNFKNLFASVVEMLMVDCKISVDDHYYRVLTLPEGDTNGTVQLGAGFFYPGYEGDAYGEITIADKITFTINDVSYTFDVTTLGEAAFSNAYELGGITIPASITLIKKEAIYDCRNLERVYVKSETPCEFEDDAFSIKVDEQTHEVLETNCMLVVPAGCKTDYQNSNWSSVFKKIKELGNEIEWPQLDENQINENEYNTCVALTKPTRWFPNGELYSEENMWEMPHMMDGNFYVSAFWQSNNSSTQTESLYQNILSSDYLQLCYNPAYLSPNYGLDYVAYENHDQQSGSTLGGFICFKVKGPGTIIVRGLTESNNAYIGICVPGNSPSYFSGTEDREVSYSYSLSDDTEAYAYIYGANLSPLGRHGYIRYIKFVPGGIVNADVSVGGIPIEEESDDVLGDDSHSVGFEWREYEDGDEENGGEDPDAGVKRFIDFADAEGGEGETPVQPSKRYYPVLILNNANLTSEDGPAIEVNSHDRFLIELRGQNIISSSNGNAAISMGTLQSEAWGGGTINIVGLGEGASLTIPSVEDVESGIYLAESSINIENAACDISGTDYGVRFQGWIPYDYDNVANCNMTLGKGVSLKLRGDKGALTGFNPQSMYNLDYYDEEEDERIEYVLLESDLEDAEVRWDMNGGVYGIQEKEWVEDPNDPDEGEWVYNDTPAKYLYFGLPPTEVPVAISSYGMATFCSKYGLNFTGIEDVKAYVVSEYDDKDNTLTLTRVYEVPAETGLVLYSTNGGEATVNVPIEEIYDYDSELFCNQLLIGCTRDEYITPVDDYGYTNFVLSVNDEKIGFYRFTTSNADGRKIEAGKAYLQIETEMVNTNGDIKGFTIVFDDDPTAIVSPFVEKREEATIYDIAGRRLTGLVKGVNIVGGKKVIVK